MSLGRSIFLKLFRYILIFLLSTLSLAGQAPRFYIQVDRLNVEEGETIMFDIVLENIDGNNMQMPDVKPFKVIQGPSTSTSVSIINGKRTGTISYQYLLMAPAAGTYKIPPATAKAGNKSLYSNELTIKVSPSGKQANIQGISGDDLTFVRLVVLEDEVYIGQQMVLDYVLYTRQNIDGYHLLNEPDLEGFYVQHISDLRDLAQKKVVNGKEYYVQVVKRDILYPQKTGTYTIGPSNISLDIPVENGRSSFFFRDTKKINIKTNKIKVKVDNLPEGAPMSFSGGVGSFEMSASVKKNTVTTGEAIVITMDIKGNGDPKIVKAPFFDIPKGIEKYEPSLLKDETSNQREEIRLHKIFEYIFVPSKDTILTIEPELAFLSAETGKYEIIKAGPFTIRVVKGNGSLTSDTALTQNQQLSTMSNDKTLYNSNDTFFASVYYYVTIVFISFLTLLAIYWKKKQIEKKKWAVAQTLDVGNIALRHLGMAKTYLDAQNLSAFYEEIASATTGYILKKFNIKNFDANINSVKSYLEKENVPDDLIETYADIQQKCEMARFAGQFVGDAKILYKNAEQLINSFERND